jgi:hypothetical protein
MRYALKIKNARNLDKIKETTVLVASLATLALLILAGEYFFLVQWAEALK